MDDAKKNFEVWEAATAVTLVQRKINDNFNEKINEKQIPKKLTKKLNLAFFSIFGGVLRTAAKNRKKCLMKTWHFWSRLC